MKLSELGIGKVLKDADFDWLGLTAEIYENKRVLAYVGSEKFIPELMNNSSITAVITSPQIATKIDEKLGKIITDNPKVDFFKLHNKLANDGFYRSSFGKQISTTATIMNNVNIIGDNVIIENNVLIEPNVTIYDNIIIKKNSIIRAGTVLGGEGFQLCSHDDQSFRVTSIGGVIIGENVEIQNNTCIDKGVFGNTVIGDFSKIDNLVHIAHDVKLGQNAFVVACSLVAGRVRTGKNVYIGPNCTISNGLTMGNNSKASLGSVVTRNIEENQTVTGNFAIEHSNFLKAFKIMLRSLKQ